MKCPYCESFNQYVTSGKDAGTRGYKRYRKCLDCGNSFITFERYNPNYLVGSKVSREKEKKNG